MTHRLVNYAEADEETSTCYYDILQENPPPENAVAAERDGHNCVITNTQFHCYHLLDYAKGHKVSSRQSSTIDMSKHLCSLFDS
jgi:hypothetical protein